MAVDKSLVSGSTSMLILRLLSEKDMYGYEMIDTLREKSQNVFELRAGTLYPLLHSMEEKGFLASLTVYCMLNEILSVESRSQLKLLAICFHTT